jgi:hypothetical protein
MQENGRQKEEMLLLAYPADSSTLNMEKTHSPKTL